MGNNPSLDGGRRPFSRTTLGLSRSELDERCKPSGLYPSWQWEDRAIRRMIGDGKLAARQKGADNRVRSDMHECPICFLHYSQVNTTQCCQAELCTECYLQVRPQKEKNTPCPFCNSARLVTKVAKTMDTAAVQERQLDEQKVIEAKIRARASSSDADAGERGFGSNLEQNTAVRLMRARSESLSSSDVDGNDVASIAMTPEDRHVLEEEIRAQHTHPLARQVEREADDRRLQNEREYYRSQSGRIRELRSAEMRARTARMARMSSDSTLLGNRRASNSRNWNEIVEAFEQSGRGGEVNTLDDLVVLEAAILLSMAEEDRRREEEGGATGATSNNNSEATNESSSFDAPQHARHGFPLVHSILADPNSARNVASAVRRSGSSRRARSLRGLHQHDANAMSNMLLRGISEAEQIEMAIAASLQQSQQQQQESTSNGDTDENEEEEDTPSTSNAAVQNSTAPPVGETAASEHVVQAEVSGSDDTSSSSDRGSANAPNGDVSGEVSSSRSDDTRSSVSSSDVESLNDERPAVETAVGSANISDSRANSEASATEHEATNVSTGESVAAAEADMGANTKQDASAAGVASLDAGSGSTAKDATIIASRNNQE